VFRSPEQVSRVARYVSLAALLMMCLTCGLARGDWPNFRGSNYDGISEETGLETRWGDKVKKAWQRDIGSAFSSFAAVGDRLYTCGAADKKQVLYCLNADNGEVIWKRPFEPEYRNEHGDGTRATPTVNEGRVYIQGAHSKLLCVDAKDGKEIWSAEFNHVPTWGYSASVLIEGDLAIGAGGNEHGALAAFDKRTGEPIWKCGNDVAGYAMPYPFTFEGKRYVVGFTGKSAIIAEVKTGREVWRTPWDTAWDVNAAMPIVHNGHLLLTSGYQTGAGLFKLSASGDNLSGQEVWRSKVMLNKFQSCVLYDNHLYVSDERAFKCVDFMSGEERWSINRVRNGTITIAEEQLFLLTEQGELRIGPVSPKEFVPTTDVSILDGRCWSAPIIHRGRLYARNLERVVCIDLRPE
jgi:outer membrane protein assembly factor BamB